jgi:hypothetical protein
MKIVINSWQNGDGLTCEEVTIWDKEGNDTGFAVHPLCECPEDAIIERDLVSCSDVVKFMEMAYNAGIKGEGFEVERKEMNPMTGRK